MFCWLMSHKHIFYYFTSQIIRAVLSAPTNRLHVCNELQGKRNIYFFCFSVSWWVSYQTPAVQQSSCLAKCLLLPCRRRPKQARSCQNFAKGRFSPLISKNKIWTFLSQWLKRGTQDIKREELSVIQSKEADGPDAQPQAFLHAIRLHTYRAGTGLKAATS